MLAKIPEFMPNAAMVAEAPLAILVCADLNLENRPATGWSTVPRRLRTCSWPRMAWVWARVVRRLSPRQADGRAPAARRPAEECRRP